MQRAFGTLLQWLFTLCVLAVIACGFRNLLGDNYEIMQRAEALACSEEPPGCAMEGMLHARSFYAQTFDYTTHRHRSVRVECLRELILIGDYACTAHPAYELNARPSAVPSAAKRSGR
jgi:hypothetical protein